MNHSPLKKIPSIVPEPLRPYFWLHVAAVNRNAILRAHLRTELARERLRHDCLLLGVDPEAAVARAEAAYREEVARAVAFPGPPQFTLAEAFDRERERAMAGEVNQ